MFPDGYGHSPHQMGHQAPSPYGMQRPPPRTTGWGWIVGVGMFVLIATGGAILAERGKSVGAQQQQDQVVLGEVRELVEVAKAAEDRARFEEVAAKLQASADKASPEMRLIVGVMIPYHRDLFEALQAREKLLKELDASPVLDVSTITSVEIVKSRIASLQRYARLNERVLELARDATGELTTRMRAAGASDKLVSDLRRGMDQGVAKQSPKERVFLSTALTLRGDEKRWAESCAGALEVLQDEWGRWSWDAKAEQVRFQDAAATARWTEARRKASTDELVMMRHEAERAVQDPAAPLELLSPAAPLAARKGFTTALLPEAARQRWPAPLPPPGVFKRIRYRSPVGDLVAYVTPDPGDGKRRPAVLWAHGGFDGIGDYLWTAGPAGNDQSVRAFLDAGLVVLCPSLRGENDNPGRLELFYGELDDVLAAAEHLRGLPYVDPDRIYMAGHSTGGTLALLAAESTDMFRAVFSFGGAPDMPRVIGQGGYGNTPFDARSEDESRIRSAVRFLGAIRRPTLYFEGETSSYVNDALHMEALAHRDERIAAAAAAGDSVNSSFGLGTPASVTVIPFEAHILRGGDHTSILPSLTRLVARKIALDTAPSWAGLRKGEAQETFDAAAPPPPRP
jgi:alpha-beta hydrolase superfamily lysophospholipase